MSATGYLFARDKGNPSKDDPNFKGLKRIMFWGVAFVPEKFETDDIFYQLTPNQLAASYGCFEDVDSIVVDIGNPRKPDKETAKHLMGLRADQILAGGYYSQMFHED